MKAVLANVRGTMKRRTAKTPEGVTTKPKGMTTRNKKPEPEPNESDEEDELEKSDNEEQEIRETRVPQNWWQDLSQYKRKFNSKSYLQMAYLLCWLNQLRRAWYHM